MGQRTLDAIGLGLQFEQRRILRLAAGAAMIDDQLLRHHPRDVRALILLDHGQGKIDAGGHAGRSPSDNQGLVVLECEQHCPGTALVFLGSTLHGAGANTTMAARRGMIISYCLGWLKPYENQWLAYPPSVARRFEPDLAGLVGYRQHRPNLGKYEGVCPSILLRDDIPDHSGAVDALRPDQRDAVAAHRRAQEPLPRKLHCRGSGRGSRSGTTSRR